MIKVEVDVKYTAGHTYSESWASTALFCPACGKQTVWKSSAEDYDHGYEHLCLSCDGRFYLYGGIETGGVAGVDDVGAAEKDEQGRWRMGRWQTDQRLAAIRAAIAKGATP